jgi:hypothetical protein
VVAYEYHFSKQPKVSVSIRGPESPLEPADITAFRTLAQQNHWQITEYPTNDDSHVPGCQPGDTEHLLSATDGTMVYSMVQRTCGPFPTYYVVYPASLHASHYDPYRGVTVQDSVAPNVVTFTPGTEPPTMH